MSWLRPRLWIPIALALLLTGCGETLARLTVDVTYLHEAAGNYVREIHGFRQFIRAECKASLVREIDTVRQEGDEAALRALLSRNYPGLVSLEVIAQAQEGASAVLATAPGCNGADPPQPE